MIPFVKKYFYFYIDMHISASRDVWEGWLTKCYSGNFWGVEVLLSSVWLKKNFFFLEQENLKKKEKPLGK